MRKTVYIESGNQIKESFSHKPNERPTEATMNMNHYRAGFKDAMAGCYDKWYRYNSKDNGFSYDCGFKAARNDGASINQIIECMH